MRTGNKDNLLIVKRPDLLEEWDYTRNADAGIDVSMITCGSKKKAWWRCYVCHGEYQMTVHHKTSGQGCPYCSGHRVLKGYNDLLTCNHELICNEWDWAENDKRGLKPDCITSGSETEAWWRCDTCNGKYEMPISSKTSGQRCLYCSGRMVLKGYNDLMTLHPELVSSEWDWAENDKHGLKPDELTCGLQNKAYWHCPACHGIYDMLIIDKVKGRGCPYCNSQKVLKGFNDLASCYPELIESSWDWAENDKHDLKPDEVTCHSNKKAYWHCNVCNGRYKSMISCKTNGRGCPFCAGVRVLVGFNDLMSNYPELVNSEWDWIENDKHGLKPDSILSKSHRKVWWNCNYCHGKYEMKIQYKTSGQGCPFCAGKRVLKGFNDLQSLYPELVKSEWDYEKNNAIGLKPDEITSKSDKKAWWICESYKHSWMTTVYNRTGLGSKCPHCINRISKQEDEVADFIKNYLHDNYVNIKTVMRRSITFKKIYEVKKLDPDTVLTDCLQSHLRKELDIYISELGFAVEYDGDYWHSDEVVMKTKGMTNAEAHSIKQSLCQQANITLMFITEHDWLHDTENVKQMITRMIDNRISEYNK